jgi:hypothetical protein
MEAGLSTCFLHSAEEGKLVPVGFRVVVEGDGLEQLHWRILGTPNEIGHAYDGSRIHATTKLSKDRRSRYGTTLHRLPEELQEMLVILNVAAVGYCIFHDPLPMSVGDNGIAAKSEVMSRRNRSYGAVGSQLTGRLAGKVEGGEVFIEIGGPSIGEERLKIRRPEDTTVRAFEIK